MIDSNCQEASVVEQFRTLLEVSAENNFDDAMSELFQQHTMSRPFLMKWFEILNTTNDDSCHNKMSFFECIKKGFCHFSEPSLCHLVTINKELRKQMLIEMFGVVAGVYDDEISRELFGCQKFQKLNRQRLSQPVQEDHHRAPRTVAEHDAFWNSFNFEVPEGDKHFLLSGKSNNGKRSEGIKVNGENFCISCRLFLQNVSLSKNLTKFLFL